MATYGSGQMLGSGINPESFKQDYSGFARAAEMQAKGLSNLGDSISGAIKDYGEMKKSQQEDERAVQKSKSVAKAIGDLIPDLKPTLLNSLAILDNKELPLSQRKAEADAISDILNLGIGEIRNKQQFKMEEDQNIRAARIKQAQIDAEANKPGSLETIAVPGGTQQMIRNPKTGIFEPIKIAGNIDTALNLPSSQGSQQLLDGNGTAMDGAPGVLPSINDPMNNAAEAIAYANRITGGRNDISNLSPMPTRVTTNQPPQALRIDSLPSGAMPTTPKTPFGFTPEKTGGSETYRPFTPEEIALYGSQGQVSSTGKVYPIRPPTGTKFTTNPNGSVTYETGAGVGAKTEKAERSSKFQETRQTNFIIDKANEAEEIIDNSISTYGGGTLIDIAKATIPGTQEYKLKNQILPALKDSIALDSIKQLKAASPTGSTGLGSVTEKEGKRLENMYGVLDIGGDKVTLKNDLKKLKQTAFDYIHGSKDEREKALQKGDITKDQNDQVERMYREQILGVDASKSKEIQFIIPSSNSEFLYEKYLQK
jgi:hypothetical protein